MTSPQVADVTMIVKDRGLLRGLVKLVPLEKKVSMLQHKKRLAEVTEAKCSAWKMGGGSIHACRGSNLQLAACRARLYHVRSCRERPYRGWFCCLATAHCYPSCNLSDSSPDRAPA